MKQKLASIVPVVLAASVLASCGSSNSTDADSTQLSTLAWIDRDGRVEPIDIPPRTYIYAQLSPDGTRIALNSRDETSDIWILDLQSEGLRRLTPDLTPNIGPLWAPDGRLAYTRVINGTQEIVLQAADGSAPAEQLSILSDDNKYPTSFSSDGRTLIFHTSTFGYDMWSLSLEGESRTNRQLLTSQFRETNGVLSPNDRWLAFESDESGQLEIYVSSYPDVDSARVQISVDGGSRPHWHPGGSELIYIDQHEAEESGAMMAVPFDADSGVASGSPQMLFEGNFHSPVQGQGRQLYDISEDGRRFLMIRRSSQREN